MLRYHEELQTPAYLLFLSTGTHDSIKTKVKVVTHNPDILNSSCARFVTQRVYNKKISMASTICRAFKELANVKFRTQFTVKFDCRKQTRTTVSSTLYHVV